MQRGLFKMNILLTANTTFNIANFRDGIVRRLLAEGHEVIVCAPRDDYVDEIEKMGCRYIPIEINKHNTSPLIEIHHFISILKVLRKIRPDLVFSFTIKNNIFFGLACRLLQIKFAPNVTGLGLAFDIKGIRAYIIVLLYKFAFYKTQKVFFQNGSDLTTFCEKKIITRSRAHLLPGSGVNLTKFPFSKLPDVRDGFRFLMVSRLLREKGIEIYAQAAELVRQHYPKTEFHLLGPFDTKSCNGISTVELDSWVRKRQIIYQGSARDVLPFLQNAHCVVLPTHYREGTPRSLLEAASVGRPIITTNIAGCRDLVHQGQNGMLVAPQNVEQLTEACFHILKVSQRKRQVMGNASRNHIMRSYSEQIIIDAYLAIVNDPRNSKQKN